MNNKILLCFSAIVLIALGLFSMNWPTTVNNSADSYEAGILNKSLSVNNAADSFSSTLAYEDKNPRLTSSVSEQHSSASSHAQSPDASIESSSSYVPSNSIYYSDQPASQGSPVSLLDRKREFTRKEIQDILKTPEEKRHELWVKYSTQVPELHRQEKCGGMLHLGIDKLKEMTEAGNRCAMGFYANEMSIMLTRDYVTNAGQDFTVLRQKLTPYMEYLGQSTGVHITAPQSRGCIYAKYYNDTKEALAWIMIRAAYDRHTIYDLNSFCQPYLPAPDEEKAYQGALALALMYVDYYHLIK